MKRLTVLLSAALLALTALATAAIPSKSWTIELTPAGDLNSKAPDGNIGASCTWDPIPDVIVSNGASGSLNLADYANCTVSGITIAATPDLPAGGFSYSGTTISWSSTTSSSIQFTATVNGEATSEQVLLQSTGNDADTTAPSAPSLDCSPLSTTSIRCVVRFLADPWVSGQVASGNKDARLYVNGSSTPAATATAGSVGLSLPLQATAIGDAASTSASQSVAQWTLGATSGAFYGGTKNGLLVTPAAGIAGDFSIISCGSSWTNAYQWAKRGNIITKTLTADSASTWTAQFPDSQARGFILEHQLTTGAAGTQESLIGGVTSPLCHRQDREGNTITAYTSPDGNSWVNRGSETVAMTDPVFPGIYIGEGNGGAMSAVFSRVSINNVTPVTVDITGLSAGTSYSITADARDQANNVSALTAAVTVSTQAASGDGAVAKWPRWCPVAIGGNRQYDTAAQRARLKRMTCVVTGIWDGWQSGRSMTWGQVVADVVNNSLRSTGTKIWAYYEPQGIYDAPSGPDGTANAVELYTKYRANPSWLLWQSGTSGTPVENFWRDYLDQANYYPGSATDGSGRTMPQWTMQFALDINYTGGTFGTTNGGNSAAPLIYGMLLDNLPYFPGICAGCGYVGDYDRDGADNPEGENNGNTTSLWLPWRQGYDGMFSAILAYAPSLKIAANTSQYQHPNSAGQLEPFTARLNGGFMESMIGASNSIESWGGFAAARDAYWRQEALMQPNYYAGLGHHVNSATGGDYVDPSGGYRPVKYGIAFTFVLGDAGYSANEGDSAGYGLDGVAFFDYLSVNPDTGVATTEAAATTATLEWMGLPDGEGQVHAATGIYYRVWTNGSHKIVCALNPPGNGSKTLPQAVLTGVKATGTWKNIQGLQDTGVDNGATVGSGISMGARTGHCVLN